MLAQPVRVVGMALACAVATATLALVTLLISNLVLDAVAGLSPTQVAASTEDTDGVQGALVAGRPDAEPERRGCERSQAGERHRNHEVDGAARCRVQRDAAGGPRR